jgi:hypothetical protein
VLGFARIVPSTKMRKIVLTFWTSETFRTGLSQSCIPRVRGMLSKSIAGVEDPKVDFIDGFDKVIFICFHRKWFQNDEQATQ